MVQLYLVGDAAAFLHRGITPDQHDLCLAAGSADGTRDFAVLRAAHARRGFADGALHVVHRDMEGVRLVAAGGTFFGGHGEGRFGFSGRDGDFLRTQFEVAVIAGACLEVAVHVDVQRYRMVRRFAQGDFVGRRFACAQHRLLGAEADFRCIGGFVVNDSAGYFAVRAVEVGTGDAVNAHVELAGIEVAGTAVDFVVVRGADGKGRPRFARRDAHCFAAERQAVQRGTTLVVTQLQVHVHVLCRGFVQRNGIGGLTAFRQAGRPVHAEVGHIGRLVIGVHDR